EPFARALCMFVRCAIEHPEAARVLWRLHSGATLADAPISSRMRASVERGRRAQRVRHDGVEWGLLLVMGIVVIALRHVLEERLATPASSVATRMAAGMLRALGIAPAQAEKIARAAVGDLLSHSGT